MDLYKVVFENMVVGVGTYGDCVACIEWLEEEGTPCGVMRIEKY